MQEVKGCRQRILAEWEFWNSRDFRLNSGSEKCVSLGGWLYKSEYLILTMAWDSAGGKERMGHYWRKCVASKDQNRVHISTSGDSDGTESACTAEIQVQYKNKPVLKDRRCGHKESDMTERLSLSQRKATLCAVQDVWAGFISSDLKLSFSGSEAEVLGFIFLNYFMLYHFGMFIHEFLYYGCLHPCMSKSYQSFKTSSHATLSKKASSFSLFKHWFVSIFLLDYKN